jgi:hypothetical protein
MGRINSMVSFNYKYFDMQLTDIVWLSFRPACTGSRTLWTQVPHIRYPHPRPTDRQGARWRPTTSRVISHQPDVATTSSSHVFSEVRKSDLGSSSAHWNPTPYMTWWGVAGYTSALRTPHGCNTARQLSWHGDKTWHSQLNTKNRSRRGTL